MIWITFKAHGHKAFTKKISFIMEENIMRKHKRLAAILTASLLAITPCVSAGMMNSMAIDNALTIVAAKAGTHNYAAYQIFKGTLSGDGSEEDPYVLSDIQWGENISGETFLTALKNAPEFKLDPPAEGSEEKTSIFAKATSAEDVAGVLKTYDDDSDVAIAFAKFAGDKVTGSAKGTDDSPSDDGKTYNITPLDAGYYVVKDLADIADGENATPRTLNMLEIVGPVSIDTKEDLPTIEKKIVNPNVNEAKDANTASVGDIVEYKLTSNVPNMKGYDKYFFVVNDTMEEGLTFNPDSVIITIGGTKLTNTPTQTYEVQTGDDAKVEDTQYTFQIVLDNFIQYKNRVGDQIVITYNATVNNAATAGSTVDSANVNTVNLTYSNNPNVASTGENEPNPGDDDTPGDAVGTTPDDKTYTYLTELEIEKVDKDDSTKFLAGAKFELTGESLNAVVHEEGMFIKSEDADAEYYLLKDGTYTKDAPVTEGDGKNDNLYASTTQKYKLVTNTSTIESTNRISASGVTAERTETSTGNIVFGKLGVGEYTIVETEAPTGYNKLTEPIKITIGATPSSTGCKWSYQKDSEAASISSNKVTIQNAQGATLPSTGGIGTKLFYLFGGMLAVGSGVVLVTKKRMANIEK